MSTKTLKAKEIHESNIISDGFYVLTPFYLFDPYLYVRCKNGIFYKKNTEESALIPIDKKLLDKYSHYIEYFDGIDVGNSYVNYEEIIEYSTIFMNGTDNVGFLFTDCNQQSFILSTIDDKFSMQLVFDGNMTCMKEGFIGWHDIDLPNNFDILNSVLLSEKELVDLMKNLTYFGKEYCLPNIKNKKTSDRGYSSFSYNMINDSEFSIQESSSGCGSRLWVGVSSPRIKHEGIIYKDSKDFFNAAYKNKIDSYNVDYKVKSIDLPSRIHISNYYCDPMLKVMNILLKQIKEKKQK